MLGRLSRGLVRSFCSNKPLQQTGSSAITEPNRSNEIPIHLRPYDKKKYEVLMDKIKLNSGKFLLRKGTHSWKSSHSLAQRS